MNQTAPPPIPRPALARFIWERGLLLKQVALDLGCSYEQVRRICLAFSDPDRRVPGTALMARIVEWSEGEIRPGDFYPAHLTNATSGGAAQDLDVVGGGVEIIANAVQPAGELLHRGPAPGCADA